MNAAMIVQKFGKTNIKLPAMSGAAFKLLLNDLARLRAERARFAK